MYKYQNVSKEVQTITKDGVITPRIVKPGDFCMSAVAIENPNFKYVGTDQDNESTVVSEQAPQPNMITDVTPLTETPKENN